MVVVVVGAAGVAAAPAGAAGVTTAGAASAGVAGMVVVVVVAAGTAAGASDSFWQPARARAAIEAAARTVSLNDMWEIPPTDHETDPGVSRIPGGEGVSSTSMPKMQVADRLRFIQFYCVSASDAEDAWLRRFLLLLSLMRRTTSGLELRNSPDILESIRVLGGALLACCNCTLAGLRSSFRPQLEP